MVTPENVKKLSDEIKDFQNCTGMVLPNLKSKYLLREPPPFIHPLVYTCLYYLLNPSPGEFYAFVIRHQIEPGLLSFHPDVPVSEIEYVAIAAVAYKLDYSIALQIYNYGFNGVHLWWKLFLMFFYNNKNPGYRYQAEMSPPNIHTQESKAHAPEDKSIYWKVWYGRHPWFVCHLKFCSWKNPNIFYRLLWCWKVLRISRSTDDWDWLLGYWLTITVVHADERRNSICNAFAAVWDRRFLKRYPRAMPELLERLLGHSHPLTKYWPQYKTKEVN